ncbi:DNA polymerase subunit beta [Acidianus sulfidivorans JP7]|uniref:protein adenylyltransferase n=1 Tax=Acidianus sulfidivorans JP7 TaxID=619593 RepID=A0A2U9IM34_9CREN|nr:nucleotidyltransferase domain-containing protein [Acidianus sulfidivorans]AWR97129.1 DNA polymerase subunit beta [Acidianus sulfidivorans JP7]
MEIQYNDVQWKLLNEKREIARKLLERLQQNSIPGYIYGSIARGDVRKDSDIDIVVFYPKIFELDMLEADHKFIIQATPLSTPKAYISIDPKEMIVISFPLSKLKKDEEEFYYFGGILNLEGILENKRVPGINKKLELIIPNQNGHTEIPLLNNEDLAAKILKISLSTIKEREKLLLKREDKGRSGVFLRYDLDPDQNFEEAIRELYKSNKYFRRIIDASR